MSDLYNKYIQDPSDPSNFIKCENKYKNCDTCNNNLCLSCKSDSTFINKNKMNCVKKSDLNNTYIFFPLILSEILKIILDFLNIFFSVLYFQFFNYSFECN